MEKQPASIEEELTLVAIDESSLVSIYDDGPGWPITPEKERAYRQGFLEEARRVVQVWAHPIDELAAPFDPRPVSLKTLMEKMEKRFNPSKEIRAAEKMRRRSRKRFSVLTPDKKHFLGYRPRHEIPAARLRGRHHAMAFVIEPQQYIETADIDVFDPALLCPWLKAVEEWANKPIPPKRIVPPPRPLDVAKLLRPHMDYSPEMQPAAIEAPASPPARLKLTRADMIRIAPPAWLLRGILERDTFALVFGDPGSGKSFLAIDWACRIATGTHWRGHNVEKGAVIYVAGEGLNGLGRRFKAWQQHNDVSLAGAPLYIAPSVAIPEVPQLTDMINAVESELGRPVLVVLDTLARCFGGGDENSTQDMSRFVSACDALRKRWGCSILVVHHTGHADKNRARGAIALKAALDAEYRLSANEAIQLTATKMKDAETPLPLGLELVRVELPDMADDYGNPITSAAIEVVDADTEAIAAQAETARRRGKWQKHGLEIARRLVEQSKSGWVDVFAWRSASTEAGMCRQTQLRVLETMAEYGEIVRNGDHITLASD